MATFLVVFGAVALEYQPRLTTRTGIPQGGAEKTMDDDLTHLRREPNPRRRPSQNG